MKKDPLEKLTDTLKKFEEEIRQDERDNLKHALYKLDWIQILNEAINSRPTSWAKDPVIEWRNASDQICSSTVTALIMGGFATSFIIPGKKISINTENSCPKCGCIYDDKAKLGQGRNGGCECSCKHTSPEKRLLK